MTEAPERIWGEVFRRDEGGHTLTIAGDYPLHKEDSVEYIRADLARPKVRPLEWVDLSEANRYLCYADTSFGGYRIRQIFFPESCFVVVTPTELRISENTLEEAKASAQRDYNRRILAALY